MPVHFPELGFIRVGVSVYIHEYGLLMYVCDLQLSISSVHI